MAKRDVIMKDIHLKCIDPEDTDKKCDILSTVRYELSTKGVRNLIVLFSLVLVFVMMAVLKVHYFDNLEESVTHQLHEQRAKIDDLENDLTKTKVHFDAVVMAQNRLFADQLSLTNATIRDTREQIAEDLQQQRSELNELESILENLNNSVRQTSDQLTNAVARHNETLHSEVGKLNAMLLNKTQQLASAVNANKVDTETQISQINASFQQSVGSLASSKSVLVEQIRELREQLAAAQSKDDELEDAILDLGEIQTNQAAEYEARAGAPRGAYGGTETVLVGFIISILLARVL